MVFRGFSLQHFSISAFQRLPKCGSWWLCPAVQGSKFEVRGSKFGVQYKLSEYIPPLPPRSGRSGGTLDKPWTYPGTIDHPQSPIFKQASLSKSMTESSAPVPCAWRFAGGGHLKSRSGTSREMTQMTQKGKAAVEVKTALTQRRRDSQKDAEKEESKGSSPLRSSAPSASLR